MKITKTMLVLGITFAVLASSIGMFQFATAEHQPVLLEELELVTGSTDKFGGGDYVALKIRDARFAVHYGNETNPNGILITSEITRYLGGADIYRENGELVRSGAMPVRTALAQDLKFMVEFEDFDMDGMLANAAPGDFRELKGPEPVKALTLVQTWEISEITEGEDANGNRTWDFSLSAYDIPYDRVWEDNGTWREATEDDGVVEEISFIFHITASEVTFDIDVPWAEITMTEQKGRFGGPKMAGPRMAQTMEMERAGNKTFNGTKVTADVKYDHYINGWDFESYDNLLALETHTMMGDHWHDKAPEMIRNRFEHRIGENCEARMEEGAGEIRTDFSEPLQPRFVHKNRIEFADEWQRVGKFSWVSDVEITNDGMTTTEEMRFQVHGGGKVIKQGFDGKNFVGFGLKAAFIYPAGEEIFHDPGLTTDALFMDVGSVNEAFSPAGILLQATIATLAVAGVVGYRLYSKNGETDGEE
ncbi:MAG: hypothetical protein KAS67_01500 [Thermoplasmata archaeon]|nr:hypothetical protein [Thermoplasmata archaeon]